MSSDVVVEHGEDDEEERTGDAFEAGLEKSSLETRPDETQGKDEGRSPSTAPPVCEPVPLVLEESPPVVEVGGGSAPSAAVASFPIPTASDISSLEFTSAPAATIGPKSTRRSLEFKEETIATALADLTEVMESGPPTPGFMDNPDSSL